MKNEIFHENKINGDHNNSKNLWNIINDIAGRNRKSPPAFIEDEGVFITKPKEIANYISSYFKEKVENLKTIISNIANNTKSNELIRDKLMERKTLQIKFKKCKRS